MANVLVPITPGNSAQSADFAQESTTQGLRQIITVGDPTTKAAQAKVTNADPGNTDYGIVSRIINSAASPIFNVGNAASGATDAGNPVKVGGKYNASAPTLTDGQRGDAQLDVNGNWKSTLATLLQGLIAGVESDSILAYPALRPDAFQAVKNFASGSAQTILAGVGGKNIYVTDLLISTDGGAACNVIIQDSTGTPVVLVPKIYLPASAVNVPVPLRTPIKVATGKDLAALCSSGTPNISILALGYQF